MPTHNQQDDQQYIVRSEMAADPIPNCSVGEFLKKRIEQTDPERVALINATIDQKITYGEIDRQATQIASALIGLGIESSDSALFYAENSIQYGLMTLSLSYLGLIASPTKPTNKRFEIVHQLTEIAGRLMIVSSNKLPIVRQMMDDNRPKDGALISNLKMLIILDEENLQESDRLSILEHQNSPKNVITVGELIKLGTGKPRLSSIPHFPVKDPSSETYLIVYTSGSTGLPKGVIHTHRSYVASLQNLGYYRMWTDGSTVACLYPFGHISGTIFLAAFLAHSCSTVIFATLTTGQYLQAIERYKIENCAIYPSVLLDFYQNMDEYHTKYDLSSIKIIFYCSTKYPKKQLELVMNKLNVTLEEMYASSEFCPNVANVDKDGKPMAYHYGKLGKLLPNVEMKIVDIETGHALPANREGEICFRGPNRFMKYLNRPKETAQTIDQDGWYHSGDVGYYDQQRNLYMTDRIKELVKFCYFSLSPLEVECFLQSHPAVHDCCVVPVPHQTEGSHLRAYVVLNDSMANTSEQQLLDYVKENIASHKRLFGGVRFVDDIPRTEELGKIIRTHFKDLVKNEVLTELADL